MKAIVFSDIHLHTYKAFDKDGSRLQYCIDCLRAILSVASNENAPLIFCGDLFNVNGLIPVRVLNKLILLLNEYRHVKIYAITGNHDHINTNYYERPAESALEFLANIYANFILLDNKTVTLGKGVKLHGIPYYKINADFYNAAADLELSSNHFDIIIGHQTPAEISNKYIPSDITIKDMPSANLLLFGHIHKPEKLSSNAYMIGSPLHRDSGDIGDQKGYWILEIKANKYTMTFVHLDQFPIYEIVNELDEESSNYQVLQKIVIDESMEEEELEHFTLDNSKEDLMEAYAYKMNLDLEAKNIGLEILNSVDEAN